jgi:hypothetical protein
MPHAAVALVLALATGAVNLAELVAFSDGYLPRQILLIALWAVLPALGVYWLGKRFIRSALPAKLLCGGLGLALALGAFGAWDVFLGPGRDEPLNGLIVVMVPTYQNLVLLVSFVASWLVEWRLRSSASAG